MSVVPIPVRAAPAEPALQSSSGGMQLPHAPPVVTIIGKSNKVGLERDLALLAEVLRKCGCQVQVHATDRRDARRRRSIVYQSLARVSAWIRGRGGDPRRGGSGTGAAPLCINLMLEHIWPQFLDGSALNISVPNPEWFDRRDRRLMRTLDGVWAKTRYTQGIFEALGCRTAYIGFDSDDRYQPEVLRERSFFHLAGRSRMKGTDRLLRLWARHPEWPPLVLVYHEQKGLAVPRGGNIRWYREYLADSELRRLQNASRFHLCLSEAEGWGHYIVEAMSVGAVTVTLDAPPMNELVGPERGLLVSCSRQGRQNLSETFRVDELALERTVIRALELDESTVARLGQAARQWFLENRRGFPQRVGKAIATVETLGER